MLKSHVFNIISSFINASSYLIFMNCKIQKNKDKMNAKEYEWLNQIKYLSSLSYSSIAQFLNHIRQIQNTSQNLLIVRQTDRRNVDWCIFAFLTDLSPFLCVEVQHRLFVFLNELNCRAWVCLELLDTLDHLFGGFLKF